MIQIVRLALLPIIVAAAAAACRGQGEAPPFSGLEPTSEQAAQAVVEAMAVGDLARLERLAVTADEFRGTVWPALPASAAAVGMPADYVWSDTELKSRTGLAETLAAQQGAVLTVTGVRFAGESTSYDGFELHRDTRVTVREAGGPEREVRLFGSMIETDAGWKVYSYIVD